MARRDTSISLVAIFGRPVLEQDTQTTSRVLPQHGRGSSAVVVLQTVRSCPSNFLPQNCKIPIARKGWGVEVPGILVVCRRRKHGRYISSVHPCRKHDSLKATIISYGGQNERVVGDSLYGRHDVLYVLCEAPRHHNDVNFLCGKPIDCLIVDTRG